EALHGRRIPGHDHQQLVAVVFHRFHERIDRLLTEVVGRERIRLVDEERAAQRLLNHLTGFDRGLTYVAGDQERAVAFDEVTLRKEPDRAVDARDQPGNRRFAGAGIADEHKVAGHVGRLQPGCGTQALDAQRLRLVPDLRLDRVETDERFELGEQL